MGKLVVSYVMKRKADGKKFGKYRVFNSAQSARRGLRGIQSSRQFVKTGSVKPSRF